MEKLQEAYERRQQELATSKANNKFADLDF